MSKFLLLFFIQFATADYFILNEKNTIVYYSMERSILGFLPKGLTEHEIEKSLYADSVLLGYSTALLDKKKEKVIGFYTDNRRYQVYVRNKCREAFEE